MTRTARQKRIRAQRREGLATRTGCPHPQKRAYKDEEAVKHALIRSKHAGRAIAIYKCECGTLHLTRQRARKGVPNEDPRNKA